MRNFAADYYENFSKASTIVRPHPYADSPTVEFDNHNEHIPKVKLNELLDTIQSKKKKNPLMLMVFQIICFTFLIVITGLCY